MLRELVLQTAAQPRRTAAGAQRLPELLKSRRPRQPAAPAVHGQAADAARPVHQVGRRLSRRLVRERADQGRLRLRRASSATTPAPTRRARPTCCCTTCFGEVNGKKGAWGHAIGGMGAITQAMAQGCRDARRGDRDRAPVREVLVEKGRAVGVVLEGGERSAPRPWSANAQSEAALTTSWCPRRRCRADFSRRIATLALRLRHLPHERRAVGTAELHLRCRAEQLADHHTAGIIIAPSLAYMDRAYVDARRHGWSPRADRRDADPLDPRRQRWRRRASTSRACSASTSRRNCPTAAPGTTIARRSPT